MGDNTRRYSERHAEVLKLHGDAAKRYAATMRGVLRGLLPAEVSSELLGLVCEGLERAYLDGALAALDMAWSRSAARRRR